MQSKFTFTFDLFDNFQGMCFILSGDGKILDINKSVSINLKKTSEDLIGLNFFSIIDSSYSTKTEQIFKKCMTENRAMTIPCKFQAADSLLSVNLFFKPYMENGAAKPSEFCFALARDITEEKKMEMDLLRFYYVAQHTVNPLQITDKEGEMIYVNPAFVTVSGYSAEELIGKNPSIFGSGKQSKKFWKQMWSTISSGKVWVGEVENKKKNGEPFHTQLLISPIINPEGKLEGYFGIHRDLSEKRTLEKQLVHTQKMESMGTLAAGIAHEVGNPLASISALVQVSQRYTTDELVKEKLELVKNQITRISKIIRDLVDFSRPSNYELQLIDINKNIKEAVEIIKVGAKAKEVFFQLDLDENIPPLPLVADQIQQVFVNILLNAVDALTESNKKEQIISIKSAMNHEELVLTFYDNGTGIKEENMPKIFEPFFTTKKEGKGTGLGLWVSYGIIKSFQGDIKVKSNFGAGTTFILTLPVNSN
ncbi:MAG: PAS domain S-box protein [Ignavibacteria bacterium]